MFNVSVYIGDKLARYGFGPEHPFGTDRLGVFWEFATHSTINTQVNIKSPVDANEQDILLFHTNDYLQHVKKKSKAGIGFIDSGDTPALTGIYEAALTVVGTCLDAVSNIIDQNCKRVFIPIAGLHHAARDNAAGFCVFNDCAIAIEYLRKKYSIKRVAYVDIDAHFGDGVYYGFESDAELFFVDIHEEGRTLYPGTGSEQETGVGLAIGTKLNIPIKADSDDTVFMEKWLQVEAFLIASKPEFIIFQCGADSIAGDPITHLSYTIKSHAFATARLCLLADQLCAGRLLVLGGGGYNRTNIAQAWTAVVSELIANS